MLKRRGPYMPNHLTLVRPCVSPKKKKRNERKGHACVEDDHLRVVGARATQTQAGIPGTGLPSHSPPRVPPESSKKNHGTNYSQTVLARLQASQPSGRRYPGVCTICRWQKKKNSQDMCKEVETARPFALALLSSGYMT